MTTVIGVLSTVFIALTLFINGQEIPKNEEVNMLEEDIININLFGMNMYPSWDGKADERDLTGEYVFLKKIAETNDLEISRQMKIYIRDEKTREYSEFQENFIIYKEKNNNEYSTIELTFSENEFI